MDSNYWLIIFKLFLTYTLFITYCIGLLSQKQKEIPKKKKLHKTIMFKSNTWKAK